MTNWTTNDIPDQRGRLAIVTGGNSGIGYEAALALAAKGAQVILAVRDQQKGQAAANTIKQRQPQATVEPLALDLASLASVRQFADLIHSRYQALPLLINNAGVMALPQRKTADGFEMQFGTNHLGHFALTGLLLPLIMATPGARIVTVSSFVHNSGQINLADLNGEQRYEPWTAYAQSKLANLLFAYELQRRLSASGADTLSVACHPGYAATNLQTAGPQMSGSRLGALFSQIGNALFAQSAAMGALPTLYAAVAPGVAGGAYIGPQSLGGIRGYPGVAQSSARSHDTAMAARLWQVSEEMTGVTFAVDPQIA